MLARLEEVTLVTHGDPRGRLVALEALTEVVPFAIKRIFYIFDTTPGTVRGKHAHYKNRQLLVCTSGACTIECEMPDGTKTEHLLDWPDRGLLIEGLVWHNMKEFSKDAVLLVLASEHYDEADYIRDYDEFRRMCEGHDSDI